MLAGGLSAAVAASSRRLVVRRALPPSVGCRMGLRVFSRSAFGLGSGLFAGFLSRGLSAEAQPPGPPSLSTLEQRVSALEQQQQRRPVVVCGPSGVGKGTLLGRLMADYPDDFGFSVSHTTRQPRPGEQDGVHYHFCSKEDMEAMSARSTQGIDAPPPPSPRTLALTPCRLSATHSPEPFACACGLVDAQSPRVVSSSTRACTRTCTARRSRP